MNREALRAFLPLGMFLILAGLCSAAFQPPGSIELILSLCSSAMGLALVAGVVIVWRLLK